LEFVDALWIVVAEPLLDLVVLRVAGIGGGIELVVEPRDAAAILRRRVPLTGDIARIAVGRIALADIGDCQLVLPGVAEVVEIADRGLARRQDVATLAASRRGSLPRSSSIGRPYVCLPMVNSQR
jgi:hypothetical protein